MLTDLCQIILKVTDRHLVDNLGLAVYDKGRYHTRYEQQKTSWSETEFCGLEGSQAKDSEFLRAIQKAFPMARAAKIELVDERGERVSLAVELLPSIPVE